MVSNVGFPGQQASVYNSLRSEKAKIMDYYELLQISPNADSDTIHRVYRFLASRFHPDNQQSGNAAMFGQLKMAYDALSNPSRRAEYDSARQGQARQPLSATVDFMDDLEGELNRRLAVLAVVYHRRRTSPNMPEVTLAELEERLGFPRDYLDFTNWYLQRKGYISKTDDAKYALTADGVDFVEAERAKVPTLHKLLTSASESSTGAGSQGTSITETNVLDAMNSKGGAATTPKMVHPATKELMTDRREGDGPDRRIGLPDTRIIKVERRSYVKDRRTPLPTDRRKIN